MVDQLSAQNLYLANYIHKLEFVIPKLQKQRDKALRRNQRLL